MGIGPNVFVSVARLPEKTRSDPPDWAGRSDMVIFGLMLGLDVVGSRFPDAEQNVYRRKAAARQLRLFASVSIFATRRISGSALVLKVLMPIRLASMVRLTPAMTQSPLPNTGAATVRRP